MTPMTTTQFLASLSPDAAVLLLTAGLALIAFELNRPGSILPGACGLLLTLLAFAGLGHHHAYPEAITQLIACLALLLLQLRRYLHWIFVAAVTLDLIVCLVWLEPPAQPQTNPVVATLCGLILGTGITLLTRVARRARQNKGLD